MRLAVFKVYDQDRFASEPSVMRFPADKIGLSTNWHNTTGTGMLDNERTEYNEIFLLDNPQKRWTLDGMTIKEAEAELNAALNWRPLEHVGPKVGLCGIGRPREND